MGSVTLDKIQQLLSSGAIAIPEVLLRLYSKLNISDKQLVIILQILRFREKENNLFPSVDKIADTMSTDRETIKVNMAHLMENGIISIRSNEIGVSEYRFDGLFQRLAEEWEKSINELPKHDLVLSETVKKIYPIFEREFARPLSPMETSQLIEWCEGDGFSSELIIEALKRSVLRGALNFRYIDSILRQWYKNGVTTAKEAANFEQRIKEREPESQKNVKKESKKSKSKGKYKDLYMNWGG